MAVGAACTSRLFGFGRVAACLLWLLQLILGVFTGPALVKRVVVKFVDWWNHGLYAQWGEIAEGWEARNIQAIVALEAIPPV